jgi:hypothetical protein
LLHHLALSTNFIGETALDIELSTQGKNLTDNHAQRHVFVAGLARAGTTLLMRMLYESGEFSSLTYRDMPFVLAPNLWARVSGNSQKQMDALERAHGDGILVDYDSPEAFEEVFWRVTSSKEYIAADMLIPMGGNEEVIHRFRRYIDLVLHRYQGNRYLSKNNNNTLRLPLITQAFPNAVILVPFRDPLQHAQSLLKQHRRFCEEQSNNKFVKRYMTWLGHYEFGQDHRPFQFDRNFNPDRTLIDDIDYWLQSWIDAYRFVLNQARTGEVNCMFFSYERLCDNPGVMLRKLQNLTNIPETESSGLIVKKSVDADAKTENTELLSNARCIYVELSELANLHFAV